MSSYSLLLSLYPKRDKDSSFQKNESSTDRNLSIFWRNLIFLGGCSNTSPFDMSDFKILESDWKIIYFVEYSCFLLNSILSTSTICKSCSTSNQGWSIYNRQLRMIRVANSQLRGSGSHMERDRERERERQRERENISWSNHDTDNLVMIIKIDPVNKSLMVRLRVLMFTVYII